MREKNLVHLGVRIPRTLKKLMQDFIELDAHKDLSELTRDALREKISRDAPELYRKLFKGRSGT